MPTVARPNDGPDLFDGDPDTTPGPGRAIEQVRMVLAALSNDPWETLARVEKILEQR